MLNGVLFRIYAECVQANNKLQQQVCLSVRVQSGWSLVVVVQLTAATQRTETNVCKHALGKCAVRVCVCVGL